MICIKEGGPMVYSQADNISRHMGLPQDFFPIQVWRAAQELLSGRRLPTPGLELVILVDKLNHPH